MRILSLLVAFSFALVASPSSAEVICDPESPDMCAAMIKKGERSPLTGQVLTSSLAVSLAQKAAGCADRLTLELSKAQERHKIELQLKTDVHEADLDAMTKERDLFKDKALARVPWYETPTVVASTTVVVLVALLLGASSLVD